MKKCPFCNAEVKDSDRFCVYCMSPLTPKKAATKISPTKKWGQIISALLLVFTTVTVLLLSLGNEKSVPTLSFSQTTTLSQIDTSDTSETSDDSFFLGTPSLLSSEADLKNKSSEQEKVSSFSSSISQNISNTFPLESSVSSSIKEHSSSDPMDIYSVLNSISASLSDGSSITNTDGQYTYRVANNKAVITKADASLSGEISIPSKLGGYDVVSLGNECFKGCSSVTSVIIPDGVINIGMNAFENCRAIKSVTIPQTIIRIEGQAFHSCTSLSEINIPDKFIAIGMCAFDNTAYFNKRDNWDSNNTLYLKRHIIAASASTRCEPKNGTLSIADSVYFDCDLSSIKLPESLIYIGAGAFTNCRGLKNLTIPKHVKYLGDGAFYDFDSLRTITIESGIVKINDNMFSDCGDLESVKLPKSVTEVGGFAFSNCESLTDVYYEGSLADRNEIATKFPQESSLFNATWHYNS